MFQLNDYTRVKTLGEGAEGQVLLMEHNRTKERVAVKVAYKASSMRHELEAMKAVSNHPNIIHMISNGVSGNNHYMIMELHQGDMNDWFYFLEYKKDRLDPRLNKPEDTLKRMEVHIGRALAHMQSKGWIHRDVKPGNMGLKFDADNKPWFILCDLGFSRKIIDQDGKLVAPQARDFGWATTPLYAGPQTLLGNHQYYVDDALMLVFSLIYSSYVRSNDKMFTSQNYADDALPKAEFLKEPARYMAYKNPGPLGKLPAWLLTFIEVIHKANKFFPTNPVPYDKALAPLAQELPQGEIEIKAALPQIEGLPVASAPAAPREIEGQEVKVRKAPLRFAVPEEEEEEEVNAPPPPPKPAAPAAFAPLFVNPRQLRALVVLNAPKPPLKKWIRREESEEAPAEGKIDVLARPPGNM